MDNEKKNALTAEADGLIEGRNAVIEALRAGTAIDKIYLQKGETDKTLGHIASRARAAGTVVVEADRRKLDAMSRTHAHQGVIALASVREYVSVESILNAAREKGHHIIRHAEERSREMYRVTNEYTEDALARAEEAMQMALDEVKQSRVNFRSASAAKMQEQRAKMNGTDEPESTDE